jgi:hypothetical protein
MRIRRIPSSLYNRVYSRARAALVDSHIGRCHHCAKYPYAEDFFYDYLTQ